MSDAPHIVYTPRPGVTPEDELAALVAVYRLLLDSREEKKAAPTSRPDDAMKGSNDERA